MHSTVTLHKLTLKKLQDISKKRKKNGELISKQNEILTDHINKLHKKECE